MKNAALFLALVVCLVHGSLSASNVTYLMDDYVAQNQRQFDAKVKECENDLAIFRATYNSELRAIDFQANMIEDKLEQTKARLNPLELIDSWHKQCVQNYSGSIPLSETVRRELTSCSTSAANQLTNILSSAQTSCTQLKNYHASNVKSGLADCEKRYPTSQANYSACVINVIDVANTYTVNNMKNFNTYLTSAQCTADARVNTAWDCSFTTVYTTSSKLGVANRLIDDCIANKLTCGSVSCNTRCSTQLTVQFNENDFNNATIRNPFLGLSPNVGCAEVKFKN